MGRLTGKTALVAGATRGAGRAIARVLAEEGAFVYCTGRSSRAGRGAAAAHGGEGPFVLSGRPETIEETAELIAAAGGQAEAVRVDHTVEGEVRALIERIRRGQGGLDILVNDIWGGDELTEWGKPFWELDLAKGFAMQERAVHSHILTSRHAVPLMLGRKGGLVVEITDGNTDRYRGNLFYDLAKASVIRLALAMARELKPHGITALSLTPGFLRSEAMLEHFGVTEANWRDAGAQDRDFLQSETPFFVARALAALAADPGVAARAGAALSSWELGREYGFTDIDGRRPDWGAYFDTLGR